MNFEDDYGPDIEDVQIKNAGVIITPSIGVVRLNINSLPVFLSVDLFFA